MEDNLSRKFNRRPGWDEFWFSLALLYSTRGTCDRLRTACLLVDANNRLTGAGYNGSLPGEPHCDDEGHFMVDNHCLRTLHAEENAILHSQEDLRGVTAYCLTSPCVGCAKKLISKGVARILYAREFENIQGKNEGRKFIEDLARKRGVELRWLKVPFEKIVENMTNIASGEGGLLKNYNHSDYIYNEDGHDASPKDFQQISSVDSELLEEPMPNNADLGNQARFKRMNIHAKAPQKAYKGDAGFDVFASEDKHLMPGRQAVISTGVRIAIPAGYAGFIWDKSGISSKYGIKALGGVIDSNYRGELKVTLANLGAGPYEIRTGEKIAQLIIKPVANFPLVEAEIENDTERGERGFGSSGMK